MITLLFEDTTAITGREPQKVYAFLANLSQTTLILNKNEPYFLVFFVSNYDDGEKIQRTLDLYHAKKRPLDMSVGEFVQELKEYTASIEGQADQGRDFLAVETDPWHEVHRNFPKGFMRVKLPDKSYMFLQGIATQEEIDLILDNLANLPS